MPSQDKPESRIDALFHRKPGMWREWNDSDFHEFMVLARELEAELVSAKSRSSLARGQLFNSATIALEKLGAIERFLPHTPDGDDLAAGSHTIRAVLEEIIKTSSAPAATARFESDITTVRLLLDGFKDETPIKEVRAMLDRQFGAPTDTAFRIRSAIALTDSPVAWAIYAEGSDELIDVSLLEPEEKTGIYCEPLVPKRGSFRDKSAGLPPTSAMRHSPAVVLVRQAIFHVLDGRDWNFEDDEQRVDFADQVVAFLPGAPQ